MKVFERPRLLVFILFLIINSFVPSIAYSSDSLGTIKDGFDWGMPPYAKRHPSSGFLTWNANWARNMSDRQRYQDGGIHMATIIMIPWGVLNPKENKYDWTELDQKIRFATQKKGTGYVICPVGFSKTHPNFYKNLPQKKVIPEWVERKGKISYLSNGAVATWEPGSVFQKYFKKFLTALGNRYKKDEKLIAVNMAGLDCFHGEWCWRGSGITGRFDPNDVDAVLKEAETQTRLSPEALEAWGKKFIDDYVFAFKPYQGKLTWMNSEDQCIYTPRRPKAYAPTATKLWKYAYSKGCGNRDGAVEVWNRYLNEGYGTRWTEEGYLEFNEDLAPIKNKSIWYAENEFVRLEWPKEELKIRWFTASMRSIQMRRQWVAMPAVLDQLEPLFPGFIEWQELSLAQTAKTSVDAWTWLREGYPQRNKPLKNYERWLYQRDVKPDGITIASEPFDLGNFARTNRYLYAEDFEHQARRTDVKNGSTKIYFKVDREFTKSYRGDWGLKITYLDTPDVTWTVDYSSSKTENVGELKTSGTQTWRTITLLPNKIRFLNRFKSMDFVVKVLNDHDLTIKMVRLIKLDPR